MAWLSQRPAELDLEFDLVAVDLHFDFGLHPLGHMQLNARVAELELCLTIACGERLGNADEELGGLLTGQGLRSGELDIGHRFLRHRLYRLKHTPEFWSIDFVLQAHSRRFVFDAEEAGAVRPLFDRADVIRFREHRWRPRQVEARVSELQDTYRALRPWVIKQIRREKFVEAFGYYERYVLRPLVETLRLAYVPRKSDYYVKDVYRDLPTEIVRELAKLYQVPDLEAFQLRLEKADQLFEAALDLAGSELGSSRPARERNGPR